MFNVAIGIIMIVLGVTFLYILPDYVVKVLNDSAVFSTATVNEANSKIATVRGVGFAVIVIGVIWLIIQMVAGVGGTRGKK